MPESRAETQTVCPCGARFKVRRETVGKKVRCPKCKAVFVVADATKPARPKTAPLPDSDTAPLSGFEALARLESSAKSLETAETRAARVRQCPQCGGSVPLSAVICVDCGYNIETGRTLRTAVGPTKAQKVGKLALGAGSFAFGCLLSFVGAMVGAILWGAVAAATKFEIGYLAWALGGLAGFGMSLGYRKQNARAGMVALFITLFGIFAAKIAIIVFISIPLLREAAAAAVPNESPAQQSTKKAKIRRLLAHRQHLDQLDRGVSIKDNVRSLVANRTEQARLKALTRDQVDAEIRNLAAWEAGAKWSDEVYVRKYLTHESAQKSLSEWEKYAVNPGAEAYNRKWRESVEEAKAKVEAMSADERLSAAKDIARLQDRERIVDAITDHLASVRATREGLPPYDEKSFEYSQDERERLSRLGDEELATAEKERKAWEEGGKWSDEPYVRGFLIQARIDDAIARETRPSGDESAGDSETEPVPPGDSAETQQKHRIKATAVVDRMTPSDRVQEAKDREAGTYVDPDAPTISASEAASGLLSFMWWEMFGVFDIIFMLLALATAYRVASGELSKAEEF